ncbi:hypothetical protein MMC14_004512 [Varicellaria rhodocarpa]|nr:hypothetical protein [Varicellaria rhodocarpa]
MSNTTFQINPDFSMTVENAPTNIDLSTVYTSRRTTIDVLYPSAGTSYSVMNGSPFVLGIGSPKLRRRQAGTYLGTNGQLTSSCSAANTYSLINGQLFVTTNGTTAQYSSSPGTGYELFVPSTTPGSITTTFSIGVTGALLWTSSTFFNGNALFCILPSGSVVARFDFLLQSDRTFRAAKEIRVPQGHKESKEVKACREIRDLQDRKAFRAVKGVKEFLVLQGRPAFKEAKECQGQREHKGCQDKSARLDLLVQLARKAFRVAKEFLDLLGRKAFREAKEFRGRRV